MLINLRNALMTGGKRTPTAKSYVQDGLVAMWDGIENAGWGVHDPNATVWKDLVGNYDLSRYVGSVQFNDDNAYFGGSSNLWSSSQFTATQIECVFEYDSTGTRGCVFIPHQGIENQIYIHIATNQIQLNYYPVGTRYVIDVAPSIRMSVSVRNSIGYLNGQRAEKVQSGANGWYYTYPNAILCGSGNWRADFFKGSISCIRAYSRALSAAEIAANYAVDKARFNLPDAT